MAIPAQTFDGVYIPETQFNTFINGGVHQSRYDYVWKSGIPVYCAYILRPNDSTINMLFATSEPGSYYEESIYQFYPNDYGTNPRLREMRLTYTHDNKTVYFATLGLSPIVDRFNDCPILPYQNISLNNLPDTYRLAWLMVYGNYPADNGFSVAYDLVNCVGSQSNPAKIPPNTTVTNCSFSPDFGATFNSSSAWIEGSGYEGNPIVYVWKPESGELRIGIITSDIVIHVNAYKDPYVIGGDSETGGGNGDHDDSSDPIDFPSLPSISATDTGLITLYNPSLSEIRALANYMWTNPAFDISAWKKIFADPIDAILGLSIVPVAVPDGGVRAIAVGNLTTDVNMNVAAQQYIELRCGALTVTEFWGSYLDYEPYTKAEIYLPYCGVHQLSVDDIMNKIIEVRYHIDILSGSCCAYVKCGDSVLYQFIGQCSSSIPIASGDFSEIVNSALNAALAIGSAIATSGAGVPLATALHTAGAAGAAASAAVNVQKEKIQKSGSLSGTGGMLAIQKPYLILTRPRQAHPANQYHYTGYPSFITENLSGIGGYTEIEEIHLENVPATDNELNEIVTLLESGVIF